MSTVRRRPSRFSRRWNWIPGGRGTNGEPGGPGTNPPPGNGGGNSGGSGGGGGAGGSGNGNGNGGTGSVPGGGGPTLSAATGTTTGATTADLSVSTNGTNGTLYWVVTQSSTAPTRAQVKAGLNHAGAAADDSGSQAVSGNGTQNISGGATGLVGSTVYYAHFMHERANGSQSGVATSSSFTTDSAATFPLDGLTVQAAWSMSRPLSTAYGAGSLYTASGGYISKLEDQTSNNLDMNQTIADANRPVEATAGPNSRACADFDTNDYLVGTTLANYFFAGAGYIVVSAMFDAITLNTGSPYTDHPIIGDDGGYMGLYVSDVGSPDKVSAYNYDGNQDYASSTTVTVATPYVLEWKHEGGNISLRVNGGSWINAASGNTGSLANVLHFGAGYSVGGAHFDFKLFEAAIFSVVPSSGTQDALVADFKAWVGA